MNNHHQLVEAAARHVRNSEDNLGGQLGGARSARKKVYDKLQSYRQQSLEHIENSDLDKAIEQIYHYPLKSEALNRLVNPLKHGASSEDLALIVCHLMESNQLCNIPKKDEPIEPHIICSMGLVAIKKL